MKLKTLEIEGKQYAEVSDGKPVYVDDSGTETPFDAPHTVNTITRLNAEAKSHREEKEQAETKLKEQASQFEGITDPKAAIKAMDIVKNLDDKKLVDAGEVEKVKSEAIKAAEEQFRPTIEALTNENGELKSTLRNEKIGGSFARSSFVQDKLAIPSDLVEARFGKNFSVDGEDIVAKDNSGNPIFSKERPGEMASFEESLSILVEQYPHKDSILKGSESNGTELDLKAKHKTDSKVSLAHVEGGAADRQKALSAKFPDLPAS